MVKGLRYNAVALLVCAIVCCGWSYVLDLKYYRFGYTSWDLPLYAQLMWDLCHGHVTTTLFGDNFLIDHFNGIAFLLVPFYYFFQSTLTLLYFKLFAFFTGAYIFYLLAAKRLGGVWALALMLAYIFYPANVLMIFFEFNFENLALPLIFLIFYFFEEEKFLSFMVSCFLLAIVKENMPLIVFMFGIYGFMARRQDWLRWGLGPLLMGLVMFIAEVFVIMPYLRQGLYPVIGHLDVYSKLGTSPQEILQTFVFKWPQIFSLLFNIRNGIFLSQLFGPLLLPSLLAPQILLIASPIFLQDLLSKFPGQQSINYFYASTLTVFVFMATLYFLGSTRIKFKEYLLVVLIVLLVVFDLSYTHRWRQRVVDFDEKQVVAQYLVAQIPADAKVISSYKFLIMLSQRKDLHVFALKSNKFTFKKEVIPNEVDDVIVDMPTWKENPDYVRDLLSRGPWKFQAEDGVILLKRSKF